MPDSIFIRNGAADELVSFVYPKLEDHIGDADYFAIRAIVSPKNRDVQVINNIIIQKFPGQEHLMISNDYLEDSDETGNEIMYPREFLNTLSPNGLPNNRLVLKIGCPIVLLRNVDQHRGLCNGTRLIVMECQRNVIKAMIMTGSHKGKITFIPRITLDNSSDPTLPFHIFRHQFPVKLAFAFTINKAQGQSIDWNGIYLLDHVFSHGQLYVAFSRSEYSLNTKIILK